MNRWTAGIGVWTLALLIPALCDARWEGHEPPPPGGEEAPRAGVRRYAPEGPRLEHGALLYRIVHMPELAEEVGLTGEKTAQLKRLLDDVRLREIDLRAELEKAGIEQARLLMEEPVDEAAVMAAVEKAGAIRTELAKLRIQPLIAVKQLLTPEQIERVKQIIRRHIMSRRAGEEETEGDRDMRRPRREGRGSAAEEQEPEGPPKAPEAGE